MKSGLPIDSGETSKESRFSVPWLIIDTGCSIIGDSKGECILRETMNRKFRTISESIETFFLGDIVLE